MFILSPVGPEESSSIFLDKAEVGNLAVPPGVGIQEELEAVVPTVVETKCSPPVVQLLLGFILSQLNRSVKLYSPDLSDESAHILLSGLMIIYHVDISSTSGTWLSS